MRHPMDLAMLKAAFMVAFHWFSRCGELTGNLLLLPKDLNIHPNLDALTLHLTRSKTNTTGSGTDNRVGYCDEALIRPVKSMGVSMPISSTLRQSLSMPMSSTLWHSLHANQVHTAAISLYANELHAVALSANQLRAVALSANQLRAVALSANQLHAAALTLYTNQIRAAALYLSLCWAALCWRHLPQLLRLSRLYPWCANQISGL